MTSPILVVGTAVKGERSESRSDSVGALDGRDEDQTIQTGESENPTTEKGTVMERRITVVEVAAVLGTTARFPRRLIAERRIRFVRIGRLVRVPQPAIRLRRLRWCFCESVNSHGRRG